MNRKFHGIIDDEGTNFIIAPSEYVDYRQNLLNLRGKNVDIVVGKHREKRSNPENGYYHGVVLKFLSDRTGHLPIEMHHAMKRMFLSYEEDGITYVRSTTDLNTAEFEDYLSAIRTWASSFLNLWIPKPNEIEFLT